MESIPRGWKHDGEKPVATRIHGLRDLFTERVRVGGAVGVHVQILKIKRFILCT